MTSNEIVYEPARPRKSPAGRKTDLERLQKKAEEARLVKTLEVEAKRAQRLQPDTKGALNVALTIAAVNLATAGAISYATLVAVASWMKLPWDGLNWIVPGFVELLIIFSSLDYLITKSRGGTGHAPFWAMFGFSAIAVVGNSAHTISEWGSAFTGSNWQAMIGVGLSAAAPFVVVYISKRLAALVFVDPEDR